MSVSAEERRLQRKSVRQQLNRRSLKPGTERTPQCFPFSTSKTRTASKNAYMFISSSNQILLNYVSPMELLNMLGLDICYAPLALGTSVTNFGSIEQALPSESMCFTLVNSPYSAHTVCTCVCVSVAGLMMLLLKGTVKPL